MVKTKKVAKEAPAKPTEKEPEVVTTTSKVESTGAISLGSNQHVQVGRNKCGMPWKKNSKRSQFSRGPKISFEKQMEEKERMKRIRERVAALREERRTSKQEARRRQKEKAEQKKLNEFRSSTYQVVSANKHLRLLSSRSFRAHRSTTCLKHASGEGKLARLSLRCRQRPFMRSTSDDSVVADLLDQPFN